MKLQKKNKTLEIYFPSIKNIIIIIMLYKSLVNFYEMKTFLYSLELNVKIVDT